MSALAAGLAGLMVGAAIGMIVVGFFAGAKIADLYDRLDELNTRGPA